VEGIDEARRAGQASGLEVVAGIEFSVQVQVPGHVHLLGLLIDHCHPALTSPLARITQSRAERNAKIVANLNRLGLELSLDEVLAVSGSGQTGRAHIGQALVNRGYVASLEEAMAKYLKKGRPAYENRFRLALAEAIELIHQIGGLAVIAHPVSAELDWPDLSDFLSRLKALGLDGLEAYCPSQNEAQRQGLETIARSLGLLISGGSDFHGAFKPEVKLGFGQGDLRVEARLLAELKAARRSGKRVALEPAAW